MNQHYLHGKRRLFLYCLLSLCFFSALSANAQKTIVLDNYRQQKSPTDAKVTKKLLDIREHYQMRSARQASSDGWTKEDFIEEELTPVYDDKYVVIEALADPGQVNKLHQDLMKMGLKQSSQYKHVISGLFPMDKLNELENVATLKKVRPAVRPQTRQGAVTSRGDEALRSAKARRIYGLSGEGVSIGILSDSYNNLDGEQDGIASGDLPEEGVEVLLDLPGGGSDEGRAMAEIIHDVAPGSDLLFHTAFLGSASFAQGILDLEEAGCDVIVDDVGYLTSPFFQDGIIAQAADEVTKKGVSYFSSAGNSGTMSYEHAFNNLGFKLVDEEGNELGFAHDFSGGDVYQRFLLPKVSPSGFISSLTLSLQWQDPAFSASGQVGADTDLDYYLILPELDLIFAFNDPNIGFDPVEWGGIINPTDQDLIVDLLIVKYEGPDPGLIKYINFGEAEPIEYDTQSSTIFGHPNAVGAMAVGATAWFNTPKFNDNLERPVINGFSSKGGTPILFQKNGDPQPEPKIRNKPEFVATDGVNTTFFGNNLSFSIPGTKEPDNFPNFFGTSAAAPHAAAIAALMVEASLGSIVPEEVERALKRSAIDMDDPQTQGFDEGFDFRTGRGFIQADVAMREVYKLPFPQNPLIPIAEELEYDAEADAFKAYFGYENTNESMLIIPVGEKNRFLPEPQDRGQVTEFHPGRVKEAFYVMLKAGETRTWVLQGPDNKIRTATASAPSSTDGMLSGARINMELNPSGMASFTHTQVYPNYSSGIVNLEAMVDQQQDITISVHDKMGNTVYQIQGQEYLKETTDLSFLPKGLYIVNFRMGNQRKSQKLVMH
jgi:subtilisin family serine protease